MKGQRVMAVSVRRRASARARLVTALATLATLAGPAPALGADGAAMPSRPYQFVLRAGAVENFVNFYRELVQSVGYTDITLAHDAGAPLGRATSVGAGYWAVTDDEPCLFGCDPPCPTGELPNPTVARTMFPPRCEPIHPGLNPLGVPAEVDKSLPAPAWPQSEAEARTDVSGSAAGRNTEITLPPGIRLGAVGSTAFAAVTRETGEYSGTARCFLSELVTPTGGISSITSLMRVTASPKTGQPRVTYLLSVAGTSGGTSRTEVDEHGFTIAGVNIPAGDLIGQFNTQLSAYAKSLSALGDLGVELLAPEVGQSYDGLRYRIAAPVLTVGVDPSAARSTPARAGGVRLGAAVFEGSYTDPDPILR